MKNQPVVDILADGSEGKHALQKTAGPGRMKFWCKKCRTYWRDYFAAVQCSCPATHPIKLDS